MASIDETYQNGKTRGGSRIVHVIAGAADRRVGGVFGVTRRTWKVSDERAPANQPHHGLPTTCTSRMDWAHRKPSDRLCSGYNIRACDCLVRRIKRARDPAGAHRPRPLTAGIGDVYDEGRIFGR